MKLLGITPNIECIAEIPYNKSNQPDPYIVWDLLSDEQRIINSNLIGGIIVGMRNKK